MKAKDEVLGSKDQVIVAKDEQLKAIAAAKDEQIATVKEALAETVRVKNMHIEMLEKFKPSNLLDELTAFLTWNAQLSAELARAR